MSRITNWKRESRTPTLAYRNTETGARAVLHRALDSYRYKWRGAILVDGYPVWSQGYETKDAMSFRDVLRERPVPDLSCPECPNDDVLIGEKAADGANVQRWYDSPTVDTKPPHASSTAPNGEWVAPLGAVFPPGTRWWPGSAGLGKK